MHTICLTRDIKETNRRSLFLSCCTRLWVARLPISRTEIMGFYWWALTLPLTFKFWLLLLFGFNLPAYLIHQLLLGYFFKDRDLKRRYNAKWGLVTGASSGMHSNTCRAQRLLATS